MPGRPRQPSAAAGGLALCAPRASSCDAFATHTRPAMSRLPVREPSVPTVAQRRLSRPLAALLLLSVPPGVLPAQRPTVTERTLGRAAAEYAEPFTSVAGVRELADGRVVVVDRGEKSIRLLDFAAGRATRIGHEGGGPNEFRQPMSALPLPGDSTLVFDAGNLRYLVIAPSGTVARTFSTMSGEQPDMRLLNAAGTDGSGHLYFLDRGLRLPGPGAAPGGPPGGDGKGTVLRYDPRTGTVAEVVAVALPVPKIQSSGGSNNQRVMVRLGAKPFEAQDSWAAGTDGRVAVVRHDPFRVEWVAPNGRRVTGPAIAYTKIPVTGKDKAEWRERQQSARSGLTMAVTVGGPGGGGVRAGPATSAAAPPPPEPDSWPEVKPPFLGNAAIVAPDGNLWVLRTAPAGDDVPHYDVYDGYGRLTDRIALPAGTRLVGFGRTSAYLVRTDADELQYLARYRLF